VLSRPPAIIGLGQWLFVPLCCIHSVDKVDASTVPKLIEMKKTVESIDERVCTIGGVEK
jgi:hypothetical protein